MEEVGRGVDVVGGEAEDEVGIWEMIGEGEEMPCRVDRLVLDKRAAMAI